MYSLNYFIIILIFFSNLISSIASLEACRYQERKDGPILYTNNTTLANIELLKEKNKHVLIILTPRFLIKNVVIIMRKKYVQTTQLKMIKYLLQNKN